MGKHNGKARKTGLPVGRTLENAARQQRNERPKGNNIKEESVLEPNSVEDVMTMAELAGRDFAAERQKIVVLNTHVTAVEKTATLDEISELHKRYQHLVRAPRRPPWHPGQTAESLDHQEKAAFINWRRNLAQLHEREPLLELTPYEKNLEVWRQLWRVLEFSDILVQIVDARNPLLYYSEDLVSHAKELNPSKETFVLLNKADLVPSEIRKQWVDYFESDGIRHAFWSAKSVVNGTAAVISSTEDERTRTLGVEEVLALFESMRNPSAKMADRPVVHQGQEEKRTVVGFVGYPNVGKSSTINALFGRKKTPVAPTPGRTKHFQTLNVSDTLCLCDCPGLVLPAFAKSKADMVAAGIVPVDRLVDVVNPVRVILSKIGTCLFSQTYGLSFDIGKSERMTEVAAAKAIAALALARGWTQAAGRPDQTRSGRQIIKDYTSGHLLYCESPPGYAPLIWQAPRDKLPSNEQEAGTEIAEGQPADLVEQLVLAECIDVEEGINAKPRRASHKFQRKPPRRKGNRGRQYNEDGQVTSSAFVKGSRGSLTNGLLGSRC